MADWSDAYPFHDLAWYKSLIVWYFLRSKEYWIGLVRSMDNETETDWTWMDGQPYDADHTLWSTGEPSNREGENCVRINKKGQNNGRWGDAFCTSKYNRIRAF